MGMDRLWESKLKLSRINQQQSATDDGTLPKGKFEDRHRRITIYLERDVYDRLQVVRGQGHSQTRVINSALRQFWSESGGED